ncbi:PaaI family thioesterase [Corynebacterium sp. HS2168-gen11]|uniref:PaaI family thioesterase n=1 Tax=Corynebacterium sp. HS2168-gen11 TaxID=2974027 RepID=UPI00216AB61E|nr:PaaI family thioesterase [Corynebacterium sp. HS2168-gen11]MCS4535056.1 PaaI family thioesterase [Corynebacterium sp. HS2168-gen11]
MEHSEEKQSITDQLLELLKNISPAGLHMREIATVQSLMGGFSQALGMRLTTVTPTEVTAELHVDVQHLQPAGLVNGGVFSAIGETVGSLMGLVAAEGKFVAGVNNNTDFYHSVAAGVIAAKAVVLHAGKTTQVIEVTMTHRDRVVARSVLRTVVLR